MNKKLIGKKIKYNGVLGTIISQHNQNPDVVLLELPTYNHGNQVINLNWIHNWKSKLI